RGAALSLKKTGTLSDPVGLRFEANFASGLDDYPFDTIALSEALPDGATMPDAIGANFAGQFHFDLAQSISNIEGNLEVTYVAAKEPGDDPQIKPEDKHKYVDANEEYKHDLLNFNALNVLTRYPAAAADVQ